LRELAEGRTTEARVDESVRRLLHLFAWAGVFESGTAEVTDDSDETRATIRRASIAGSVLLKNDNDLLPLQTTDRVAVLGPSAERAQPQGGGSAQVRASRPSRPLAVLEARGVPFVHQVGCRIEKRLRPMLGAFEVRYHDAFGATATENWDRLSHVWPATPHPGIDRETFTVHIGGTFTPDTDGDWTIGVTAVGPTVLRIDGDVWVDLSVPQTGGAFFGLGSQEIRVTLPCKANEVRHVEVEMGRTERAQLRGLAVGAEPAVLDDLMGMAVAAAADAEVAVVMVGTNADWETEGEDRTTMDLPGRQDELVRRVAAVNPRTVVVINAGSPVTMPWLADVSAVLQVWFPGEEFGEALADMLYGVAEPGGRLPITIPARLEDTPAYPYYPGARDHMAYGEGLLIGHRWYDAMGIATVYPFGHGLGYTSWQFDDAGLEGDARTGATVRATVRNTGLREGSTVVQVYVEPVDRRDGRPVRTLQGFAKVVVPAGGASEVQIHLPSSAFRRWDADLHAWVVDSGDRRVWVGWSSADLRLAGVCPARASA
jgi:beta-glucosidase